MNPMITEMPTTTLIKVAKPRIVVGRHHGQVRGHRVGTVTLQAFDVSDFVDHSFGVRRIVELQVKDRGFILCADQILHRAEWNEFTTAFATLDDPGNSKFIVQDID